MVSIETKSRQDIDDNTSRAITGVRFALIVLVVFIHNAINPVNFADNSIEVPFAVDIIQCIISDIFGGAAVPTFFFISSYLLFIKEDSYPVLIRKKTRRIFIPYIFWHAIIVIAFFCLLQMPFLKQYSSSINTFQTLKGWLSFFTGINNEGFGLYSPFVFQFWFLRDLFICIIFSPVIKIIVYKTPFFAFISILLLLQISFIYLGLKQAIFYFTLGCFAVKLKFNYKNLDKIKFLDIGIIYVLIIFLNLYFHFSEKKHLSGFNLIWFCMISNIAGGIFLLKISGKLCKNEKIYSILKYLANFSFWLYASHEPILLKSIQKFWTKFLPMNGYWMLAEYFGAVFFCVVISLLVGITLKKLLPKFFALITGERL